MNFQTKKLFDLTVDGKGSYGIAAPAVEKQDNLFTYLRITDIYDDGTLDDANLKSVDSPNASKYLLKPNDIVFARTGASTGRNYFYDGRDGELVYAGFLIKYSLDSQKVNPLFIKYYCLSPIYRGWVHMYTAGSTRGNINAQTFGNMEIQLPPRSQQDQAVIILDKIDRKIRNNQKINRNLHETAHAYFRYYYLKSCLKVPFVELIQILGGGTPKTGEKSFWNGNIPFFTPKDVGFPYTITTEKNITEEGLNHCNSRLYPQNTVFVTARGTVGKIGLAGVPMAMNQSCYALTGKNIDSLLVYFYALEAVSSLKHKASGAVFDAITTKDFGSEIINRIDDKSSDSLLKLIKPMFNCIVSNCFENQRLTSLRDALLPKLMSGELDVSELDI